MTEQRKTFTVPKGFVAVRDEEGRATGEVVPQAAPSAIPASPEEADYAAKREELQKWCSSAFLAGETDDSDLDLKGQLYSFLCVLINYLEPPAAALASSPPEPVVEAALAIYHAGHWICDRPVDEKGLWTALRDALGLQPGTSPKPIPAAAVAWAYYHDGLNAGVEPIVYTDRQPGNSPERGWREVALGPLLAPVPAPSDGVPICVGMATLVQLREGKPVVFADGRSLIPADDFPKSFTAPSDGMVEALRNLCDAWTGDNNGGKHLGNVTKSVKDGLAALSRIPSASGGGE